MGKLRVGVFFGGRSAEHEISIRSAKSIMQSLDKEKYEIIPIKIDRSGKFHFSKDLSISCVSCVIDENIAKYIDVAFPILHGPYGEDGSIQGLFKSFGVPFVGSGVLGSAIAMDKDVAKRLLQEAKILCAKGIVFHSYEFDCINYDRIVSELGAVVFVKPANLGSSVGISKAKSRDEFFAAVKTAFLYDRKIIIEEFIKGREIECSVLGMDAPQTSILGEIIVKSDFYSYNAKYIQDNAANLKIPADLPADVSDKMKEIAIKAFKILCCDGMARIDFFLRDNREIFLNEVNTIPGFTEEISMYPKLWEASGIPYRELLDKLIEMALERYARDITCPKTHRQ